MATSSQFTFKQWQFKVSDRCLKLNYHDSRFGDFTEQYVFSEFNVEHYFKYKQSIELAFDLLHWMAGVSYYKTQLADTLVFQGTEPNVQVAKWLQSTWQSGLAELAYENGLSWLDKIQFPEADNNHSVQQVSLAPRSLVAIGGGKDSLVSIDFLLQNNEPMTLFMVGQSPFIQSVAMQIPRPLIQVKRQVDPRLMQANKKGAYNGHVPITAINATVAVITALLCDYDAIVFSNERSANVGNVKMDGGYEANHQYSKSLVFEQALQQVIAQNITPKLHCFSLLRPFSELAIVKRFAQLPQYFSYFSSCNRNFHLSGSQNISGHWCRKCPKCAFVFLSLAMFLDKEQVIKIFGGNLLTDQSLVALMSELLGLKGNKPFECVGEVNEARMAFELIASKKTWQDDPLVRQFSGEWKPLTSVEKDIIMTPSNDHLIPDIRSFMSIFDHETH